MASYHINMSDLSSNPDLSSLSMLHVAAVNGDKSTIEILLKKSDLDDYKCDVNECDKYGRTALVYTVFGDWYDCAELLLRNGATVSKDDRDKRTPLHWAAYLGKPKFVSLLLRRMDKNSDWNTGDLDGRTPLHYAAAHRNAKCLRLLLKYALPGTLDATDREKKTALHWSVYYGNFEQVKLLKEARAKVHLRDAKWNSFLHLAVANTNPDSVRIVRYLLKINRFYSTQKDCEGRTPLHLAVANGNEAIVKELSIAPVSALDELDSLSRSALHYAVLRNNVNIVNTLILNGVSLYKEDNAGATPLHYTAKNNSVEVLERFLSCEKLEDIPDRQGRTALMWAASEGSGNVLDLMLKNPRYFDIHARDNEGLTALHFACISGHLPCVMKLISNSADVRQPDKLGQTALFKACQQDHINIADFLMNNELFDQGDFTNSSKGLSVTIVDEQEHEGDAKDKEECDCTFEGESHYTSNSGKDFVAKTGEQSGLNSKPQGNNDDREQNESPRKIETGPKVNPNTGNVCELVQPNGNSQEKSSTLKTNVPSSRLTINRKECVRNLEDCNGCTPLHFSAHSGHVAVCKWLLDNGVDPEKKDVSGRIALHGAAFNGHITCMALMLSHCERLKNDRDNDGYCALHRAASNGHLEAVKMLVLEHRAFANYRVKSSNLTPLDLAMAANQQDVTQFLIDHGGLTIAGVEEVASDTIKQYLREWIITRKRTTLKPLLEKHKMLTGDCSVKGTRNNLGTTEGYTSEIFGVEEHVQLGDGAWCFENNTNSLKFTNNDHIHVCTTGEGRNGTTATEEDTDGTNSENCHGNATERVFTTKEYCDDTITKEDHDCTTTEGVSDGTTTTNTNTTTTTKDCDGIVTKEDCDGNTTEEDCDTSSHQELNCTTINQEIDGTTVEQEFDGTSVGQEHCTIVDKKCGGTAIDQNDGTIIDQEIDSTLTPVDPTFDCVIVKQECDGTTINQEHDDTTINQACDGTTVDQANDGTLMDQTFDGTIVYQERDGTNVNQERDGTTVDPQHDGASVDQKHDGTTVEKESVGNTIDKEPQGNVETEYHRNQQHLDSEMIYSAVGETGQQNLNSTETVNATNVVDQEHRKMITSKRNYYIDRKPEKEIREPGLLNDDYMDKHIEKQLPESDSSKLRNGYIGRLVEKEVFCANNEEAITEQLACVEKPTMICFTELLPLCEMFHQESLFDSCRQGSWGTMEDLDVDLRDENGSSLLHLAAEQGNVAMCRRLVERGADLGKRDTRGRTAFHHAASNGQPKCAEILLVGKPDLISALDCDNKTGLHLAAANGHLEVVKLLTLRYNAGISERSESNMTALDCAILGHHDPLVRFLTEHGAKTSGVLENSANIIKRSIRNWRRRGVVSDTLEGMPPIQKGATSVESNKPDLEEDVSDSFGNLIGNPGTHSVSSESHVHCTNTVESSGNVVVPHLKHLPKPPPKEKRFNANFVKKYSRAPDHVVATSEKEKIFKLRRDWERIGAVRRKIKAAIVIQRFFRKYLQRRDGGETISNRKPTGESDSRSSKSSKKALPGKTQFVRKGDCLDLKSSGSSQVRTTSKEGLKSCFPTLSQTTSADSFVQSTRSKSRPESPSSHGNNLNYRSSLTTNEMVEQWLHKGTMKNESRRTVGKQRNTRRRTQSEKDPESKFNDVYLWTHSLPDGSETVSYRPRVDRIRSSCQDRRRRMAVSAGQRHLSRETLIKSVYASPAAVSYNFALDTYHPLASRRGCKQPSFPFKTSTRVRPNSMKRGVNGWVHTTKPAQFMQPSSDSSCNSR